MDGQAREDVSRCEESGPGREKGETDLASAVSHTEMSRVAVAARLPEKIRGESQKTRTVRARTTERAQSGKRVRAERQGNKPEVAKDCAEKATTQAQDAADAGAEVDQGAGRYLQGQPH